MGITRELVKGVFSRNQSVATHENESGNTVDKRGWISVRSYLCGNKFNSVLAEKDSDSSKSSEATVTQTLLEEDIQSNDSKKNIPAEKKNSISKLFHEEDAAIIIQSAFRDFLGRRQNEETKLKDDIPELFAEADSLSRNSMGTSIEVQTGNSVEVLSVLEESISVHHQEPQKPTNQIFRIKEDWDDSTVSSNISKMRIQNRIEATTRRERALAYAFSQQLRICSKKKQTSDDTEVNMGWSWLERWMATRLPHESSLSIRSNAGEQLEQTTNRCNQIYMVSKRYNCDTAGEEKESCGSNEVSIHFNGLLSVTAPKQKDGYRPPKNRLKATRSVSKRKTVPTYQYCSREHAKVCKKDSRETEQDCKRHKQKQSAESKKDIKCTDASS
ncbi:hypothetical protein CFOL_v3_05938 [Cephalotus follicularis]|uniref:IQ domain-containing protein n=1 Tax=Cephalotus follicularis TaxID=3775 RepID=A0A1Q3B3D8_CEPFO|nr:hypothetical protein CFOL_v3_05938 [Cephalotus follicularis]